MPITHMAIRMAFMAIVMKTALENVSQGCVRMHNASVEKLYDKVQVGTPVAITYSYKSFVELTSVYGYEFKGYDLKEK
ncbi:ErfK/YbiS/YcfS/YnhG family protein [Priestia megaterium]|uniref:L,D-transpeptidase family protein n=1 Tax=Priestia megaterium TaxID=1404 RepID=UPI000E127D21|nr:L,D-transpeptidase family protein [Priestia megaterium]SUX82555.1 ErfK/YbiS/YcfS/YnhG family protein [Priestia megaterium]